MDIDSLNIPEEPERFKELCEKTGIALMVGQQVHVALSRYYYVFRVTHGELTKEQAKEKLDFHLSKPMGMVIASIEKEAPLGGDLFSRISEFKDDRNWLAHDFAQEVTPSLAGGEDLGPYICRMEKIAEQAYRIMDEMHRVGEELVPVGIQQQYRRSSRSDT